MIAVLHAFSRKNTGDGLLVDLTLALLEEAGVPRAATRVLALDAASFPELPDVRQVPSEPRGKPSLHAALAAVELARGGAAEVFAARRGGAVGRLLDGATGFVAVGGGYLVADSVVRVGGVALNHLPQILAAGRSTAPSVYLPQSIGPLAAPIAPLVRRALSRIDVIYARDDVTFRELAGVTDVRRCPDLAVLQLAHRLGSIARPAGGGVGPTVLVPRELARAPGYIERVRALGALPRALWAVQADVDGPRSDRRFLARHGFADGGDLKAVLPRERPGVVVSVRLHGAIGALLAGWPAVHLSYERKGWGAYEDLGLSRWVHDARSFDPALVRAQVEALHDDPSPMFDALAARLPQLLDARAALVRELSQRFAASSRSEGRE